MSPGQRNAWEAVHSALRAGNSACFKAPSKNGIECALDEIKRLQDVERKYNALFTPGTMKVVDQPPQAGYSRAQMAATVFAGIVQGRQVQTSGRMGSILNEREELAEAAVTLADALMLRLAGL